MQEGDVVLLGLPQADGQLKTRPALLLRRLPPFGDALVCGISTQLQQAVLNFDEVIQPADADFNGSGLRAASLIRLGFLAVVPTVQLRGSIGTIALVRHQRLLKNLSDFLRP
jgi:mRNA interferase MazF